MKRSLILLALTAVCSLVVAGGARADADDVSFKARGDNEKAFMRDVTVAILKAAHHTGKKPAMLDYKITEPKPGRKDIKIKGEYYGAITSKQYIADITVKVDTSDDKNWECLDIEYSDNNTGISPSLTKIGELKKKFNKKP
jgi:hypothetical protein